MSALLPVNCVCPCCGQQHGLAHLIDLYERNYRLLERLLPELAMPFDKASSQIDGEPSLYVTVLSRARYTLELRLHYRVVAESGNGNPDVRIRVCRDAGTVEVLADAPEKRWPLATGSGQDAAQYLREQWRNNHFLLRWLEYLLACGHGFSLAARPRIPSVNTA